MACDKLRTLIFACLQTMNAPESSPRIVVGFCTYNRADRLPALVGALRSQTCDEPFELLAVDNNSTDDTPNVLHALAERAGPRLRIARELQQGIVPARNRLIEEAAGADFLIMMDDDELPQLGWVQAGLSALRDGGFDCVGGKVRVKFAPEPRPAWLVDELLGFLAEVDHGDKPFEITNHGTPIWTANVGYRTSLFRQDLRFDSRYSRVGKGVGGGEDVVMFNRLLALGCRMAYQPGMVVEHFVESWRLRRSYFLRLHFTSGLRAGLYAPDVPGRSIFGAPLYLYHQALGQAWRTLRAAARQGHWLRQGMNFTYALGHIVGAQRRARTQPDLPSA